MGAPTKSSPEPDLDALDESWDAEQPEAEDEPDDDVDLLEAGWGDPKRGRTAAEKARARDEKARLRTQRQKARAADIAQKQKPKQKRRPSAPPAPATARDASPRALPDEGDGVIRDLDIYVERLPKLPPPKLGFPPPPPPPGFFWPWPGPPS